jgi:DNA-binding transcriptional MerR regulator
VGCRAGYLSIGEVAAIVGVSAITIRSWERRYGWPEPERSRGAHRRYSNADENAFRAVAHLRRSMNTRAAIDHVRARSAG